MADDAQAGGDSAGAGSTAGGATPGFNPNNPNNFSVEANYLLIPGVLIVGLVVFLIYRLLSSYKQKELEKLEKKKRKEERKKK